MIYSFTVQGIPKAQGRPRVFRNKHTGKVHAVDPETAKDWKRTIQAQVLASPERPQAPLATALELAAEFFLPKPKYLQKRRLPPPPHVTKPDLDNLLKALKDACSGILYLDDSQICRYANIAKRYSDTPGVTFSLMEIP